MKEDLVARLREEARLDIEAYGGNGPHDLLNEAADALATAKLTYFVIGIPDELADDFESAEHAGQPLSWSRFNEDESTSDWVVTKLPDSIGQALIDYPFTQ